MNWESWAAFWAMGGYGLYVWGSFGVTVLCIVGEIWLLGRQRRQVRQRLRRLLAWDAQ
ncbi:MAG TPA: heme exporter protein CcmD [Thiobacillaceae bacterium]|nr:heme exporter protein CcmD [Thiobacillaceae bacterium]